MADAFAKASPAIPAGRILRFVPRVASAVVLLSACVVLVGWWLEEPVLRSGLPGLVAMNPATAICFALAAAALWLQADERGPGRALPVARACAITIAVVALLVLAKYVLAWHVGPDQLLFRDQLTSAAVNGIPNRMAPNTAVAFLLLGVGLPLLDAESHRGYRPGQILALAVGLIALFALVGYAYSSTPLYGLPSYIPMAINTAAAFFALALGLLCARPTHGVMARVLSRRGAGILLRRLLPAAIAGPIVLGWLRLQGEHAGLYGADFGRVLFVTVTIVLITVLIWTTSSTLERVDKEREHAEQALREAHDELELRVAERTMELVRANEKQQDAIEELEAAEEELRQQNDELTQSEERFRLLVECVKDYAIILLDPQGLVASWNAGAERIKGYQAEEIVGRPISAFYTPEDVTRGRPDELLRRARAEGRVRDEGWRVVKDGSRFWADVVITPISNERGELTGFAKVTRDITARMEAEEKLRRANDELRALVEASPLAIIAFDAEGKVVSWHGGAERLFGWTSAEVVGRPLDHVPPDKHDELRQLRQQVLGNGATLTDLETVRQRKDGSRVEVSISTARLQDSAGRLSGVVAVYSDITERRRAAEERRARETAEAASRAKSQFLANMSHELRTPLNAIIGFSELLEDQAYGELNQRQHKYVTNILSSGRHLLQLINDILDLAKIEAGRLVLEASEFTIGAALDDVQRIIEPLALAKRIAFTVESSEDLPLIADRPKLKQIFYNLVSNAIKFTPEGGRVAVAAKAVDEGILVSVTDTGIGIGPQDLERIFLEFEQVDSSYARQQEGTGLGLALTRKLVELHGGRIWVESEVGRGSTFAFVLPLTPSGPHPAGTHHQATGLPDSSDQRPVVLVVEDERAASELLAEYLSKNGYAVAHARNGAEAIDLARRLQPAAITLDVLLPDTDGLEVLATLRSLPDTREIPVVVVSITDNRELGFSLGAAAWLVKPVEREQFLEAVCRAIPPQARRPPTVLVVDDEPETVDFLSDLLASRGFRVLQASNGEEGVRLALEETPDAIVLDLIMPGVSGFDVVQRLREHPKTRDTRILISTVKDLSKDERAWLQGQVQKIVSKSGAEDLLRALRET